jgi:predicted dehydrogenase
MTDKPNPLVRNPADIRLGMAGMVDENGHPFSWSAIINGYDPALMADCGYDVIPRYLGKAARADFGIPGARVTHVWCDDATDTKRVAGASLIPHTVRQPHEMIGQVDAVLIPTDKGAEHLDRARPFVEAGVPVFIDKPLTDRLDHLRQFEKWVSEGKPIMSSSCMRYCPRFSHLRTRLGEVGEMRLITMTMAKGWARYGIHALEAIYPFLPAGGWKRIRNTGDDRHAIIHATHDSQVQVQIAVIQDLFGAMGHLTVYGTTGLVSAKFDDPFTTFKAQLTDFISYLLTGRRSYAFEETTELSLLVIGGLMSAAGNGDAIDIRALKAR